MFGLVRLAIFSATAFVAGVLYERNNVRTECLAIGQWDQGFCYNAERAQ